MPHFSEDSTRKRQGGKISSIPSLPTLLKYFAKVFIVAGAVPAPVPELVLALPDAEPGPFGHFTDNFWLGLAQLSLLPRQTFRLPADAVGIHDQRTAHCPAKRLNHVRGEMDIWATQNR